MGHITMKNSREDLRKRLNGSVIGAPPHPALYEVLRLLFSEEEASIASRMPYGFSSTGRLSRVLKEPAETLEPKLNTMADKGLLFDLSRKGRSYWYLNPLVIGFFEFTMMRVRTDVDQKTVAHKMWEYMFEDPAMGLMRDVGLGGETQLFRPLVHEDGLPADYVEVLDYERASHIVADARAWTVGLCHCRHIAEHRNEPCTNYPAGRSNPMEVCMSFGEPAEYFARRGMGRAIDRAEAMDLLEASRAARLVQLGDNVQRRPTFTCHCCSCCCELLEGYRRLRETPFLQTSNYLPRIDNDTCTRCGVCVRACPVDSLRLADVPGVAPGTVTGPGKMRRTHVVELDEEFCLGCGVCATACGREKAITMQPRARRVHTPETTIHRVMLMALERGKLQNLIFDDPDNLGHGVLRSFFKVLLTLPPSKRLLANQQLKSRFVDFLIRKSQGRPGADT